MRRVSAICVIISTLCLGNVWAAETCTFGNVRQLENGNYEVCEPYFRLLDQDVRMLEEYKLREDLYIMKAKLQADLFKVSEQQSEMWKNTANGLNDQLNARSWWSSLSPYFFFAAGVGLTLGAAWGYSKVVR